MARFGDTFDASSVEPSAPREIVPPGEYKAYIVASETKPTKAGNGQFLALDFAIIEGEHEHRHLFANLNLINPSSQAVKIARRDLSAICRAVGRMQVSDSEELHNLPLVLVVKVRPAGLDKQGVHREAQNEIGGYKPASGPAPAGYNKPAASAPRAAATPPLAAKAATPPWRK
jgi:hypothetical protein